MQARRQGSRRQPDPTSDRTARSLIDRARGSRDLAAVIVAILVASTLFASGVAARTPADRLVSVIVREAPGTDAGAAAIRAAGGTIRATLPIVDGFVAEVPAAGLPGLRGTPGIASVTPNHPVRLSEADDERDDERDDRGRWDPTQDPGSMVTIAQEVTGAAEFWTAGFWGQGVDVAIIDSGVARVNGLGGRHKVIHGPDLSFESQAAKRRHRDTYGHGTHMAGIIAGRDAAAPHRVREGHTAHFVGMAPGARIVSVKVADARGNTDVSQVIAAIDWVVQHRDRDGLNIRVLNLSFGTDGRQDYRIDPLAHAVEVAWRAGIVVVVAGGNAGGDADGLNNPAYDPFVIAVGAADPKGTRTVGDDEVTSWSSCGDGVRDPDLVAPGKSIVSLRAPGSTIDRLYPESRVGSTPRFTRGSGTSEAAAVVSGAAALLISQRPSVSPDQVKALLVSSAERIPGASTRCQGAGLVDLATARDMGTPSAGAAVQAHVPSTGTGSLELARGSNHVAIDGAVLGGEIDIFGQPFDAAAVAAASAAGTSWSDGTWNGTQWTGTGWSGIKWLGIKWLGTTWSGIKWQGDTWSGIKWMGIKWTGIKWMGTSWTGGPWSAASWE